MVVITYIYLSAILFAFLSSLRSFRLGFPFHLRLFSMLLGLTFLVELAADLTERIGHTRNNYWLYNGFAPVEFWIYGYYFYQLIRVRLARSVIFYFLVLFPVFWAVTVFFVFTFNTWNSYVIIAGSFFTVLFVVMYYYQILMTREIQSLRNLPEFWIATGMLIFYLGALPFYGALNFLWTYHQSAATTLWRILLIMDTLMYLLFSYAFLCRTINIKKS
jgi:hypothetical protein